MDGLAGKKGILGGGTSESLLGMGNLEKHI